jgi:hypothetical protein
MIENDKIIEPLCYGVWIPGAGWVKVQRPDGKKTPFATFSRALAASTARRLGHGARVEFIDSSLEDLEHDLLQAEIYNQSWIRQLFGSKK